LGFTKGAVLPFGLINDKEKQATIVIDQELWNAEKLHFHPNVNTTTLAFKQGDFKKFLDWCGNKVKVIKL